MTEILIIATRPDEIEITITNVDNIEIRKKIFNAVRDVRGSIGYQKKLIKATQYNLNIINSVLKTDLTLEQVRENGNDFLAAPLFDGEV